MRENELILPNLSVIRYFSPSKSDTTASDDDKEGYEDAHSAALPGVADLSDPLKKRVTGG